MSSQREASRHLYTHRVVCLRDDDGHGTDVNWSFVWLDGCATGHIELTAAGKTGVHSLGTCYAYVKHGRSINLKWVNAFNLLFDIITSLTCMLDLAGCLSYWRITT